jgi:hypothetical protein
MDNFSHIQQFKIKSEYLKYISSNPKLILNPILNPILNLNLNPIQTTNTNSPCCNELSSFKQIMINKFIKDLIYDSFHDCWLNTSSKSSHYGSDCIKMTQFCQYKNNIKYITEKIFDIVIGNYIKTYDDFTNITREQIVNILVDMFKIYHTNRDFYKMWLNKKLNDKYLDLSTLDIYNLTNDLDITKYNIIDKVSLELDSEITDPKIVIRPSESDSDSESESDSDSESESDSSFESDSDSDTDSNDESVYDDELPKTESYIKTESE